MLKTHETTITDLRSELEIKNVSHSKHVKAIEDLSVRAKNDTLQIEQLTQENLRLRVDFDEATEKLHNINRVRHKLEIDLEA